MLVEMVQCWLVANRSEKGGNASGLRTEFLHNNFASAMLVASCRLNLPLLFETSQVFRSHLLERAAEESRGGACVVADAGSTTISLQAKVTTTTQTE